MTNPSAIQIVGAMLFAIALIHTFSTKLFTVNPLGLLAGALVPTLVAIAAFRLL